MKYLEVKTLMKVQKEHSFYLKKKCFSAIWPYLSNKKQKPNMKSTVKGHVSSTMKLEFTPVLLQLKLVVLTFNKNLKTNCHTTRSPLMQMIISNSNINITLIKIKITTIIIMILVSIFIIVIGMAIMVMTENDNSTIIIKMKTLITTITKILTKSHKKTMLA